MLVPHSTEGLMSMKVTLYHLLLLLYHQMNLRKVRRVSVFPTPPSPSLLPYSAFQSGLHGPEKQHTAHQQPFSKCQKAKHIVEQSPWTSPCSLREWWVEADEGLFSLCYQVALSFLTLNLTFLDT